MSLVVVLDPAALRSYAADYMGPLRAPGEAAFIAAHRGDRATAPENTVPAFEAAFASGFDYVEVDVQLTLDGHAVLIHDDTLDRTTNGTGLVAESTLEQIRALDAGSWYAPEFAGTRVPVLSEFLDLLARDGNRIALLDIKGRWSQEQMRSILRDIYLRGVQNRVVFASFDLRTVANARAVAPAIPRIPILRHLPDDPVALAHSYGAIAILTRPAALEGRPDVVADMHAAGYGVMLYTLNSEEHWGEALRFGVDGIVTDRPSALDSWIARTAPGT